jgi:hypothetical protein
MAKKMSAAEYAAYHKSNRNQLDGIKHLLLPLSGTCALKMEVAGASKIIIYMTRLHGVIRQQSTSLKI